MATALVVDDSRVDQHLAGALLCDQTSLAVEYANNGREALQAMARRIPALVITDLQMPEMDGLALVEAIRLEFPTVPVILMTAHGSEDIAAQAMRRGAASYVPKRYLSRDLAETVDFVLDATQELRDQQRAVMSLQGSEFRFVLENDPPRFTAVVGYLRQQISQMGLCDETEMMRVGIALSEALSNAMTHGNLEVGSEMREDDCGSYEKLIAERRDCEPYCQRRVHLTAKISPQEAVYVVRDEGKGFDPSVLPDPTDATSLDNVSGRGLWLIRNFMDMVYHNVDGTEITMIKRRIDK